MLLCLSKRVKFLIDQVGDIFAGSLKVAVVLSNFQVTHPDIYCGDIFAGSLKSTVYFHF